MATLRVAAPSRASAFSRGTAPVALRTGARPVASKSRGGVAVRAGFFDFLQPKDEEEAPAAKSGGTKSICLDCGYIAGACVQGKVTRNSRKVALCGAALTSPSLALHRSRPGQGAVLVQVPRLRRGQEQVQAGGGGGCVRGEKRASFWRGKQHRLAPLHCA